jgi:hypothetical protein
MPSQATEQAQSLDELFSDDDTPKAYSVDELFNDDIEADVEAQVKSDEEDAAELKGKIERWLYDDLYGFELSGYGNHGYRGKITKNTKYEVGTQFSSDSRISHNIFKLCDYCWFPSSYKRMLSKDLYRKMLYAYIGSYNKDSGSSGPKPSALESFVTNGSHPLEFYQSSGLMDRMLNKLQTLVRGQVQSTISIVNNIGNSISNGVNGVKSLFSNSSDNVLKFKSQYDSPENISPLDISHKPHMTVFQYRVDSKLSQTYQLLKILFRILSSISEQDPSRPSEYFKDFEKKLRKGVYDVLIYLLKKSEVNISSVTDKEEPTWYDIQELIVNFVGKDKDRILGFPIAMYSALVPGIYAGYYEIPLISEEVPYLGSSGSGGWEPPGTDNTSSKIVKWFEDITGMGISVPLGCKWKYNQESQISSIETKFTLFNDTMAAYRKNLVFVHSLVAGSKWYNDVIFARPPCLYDVELNGSFRWMFCNAEILIKKVGKTRYIDLPCDKSQYGDAESIQLWAQGSPLNNAAAPTTQCFVPDAFSVEIKFTPIVPDNYNVYMNYIINGSAKNRIGERKNTMLTEIFKILGERISEASNTTSQSASDSSSNAANSHSTNSNEQH